MCIRDRIISNRIDAFCQEFQHEQLWSFESLNKKQWTLSKGQKLSISDGHYKHGEKSLKWNWSNTGSITLNSPIGFQPFNPESEDKSIPSFAVWVYNETPVDDYASFVFGTDATDNCSFRFKLNFKGWRAAWVAFERDMEGTPVTTMNRLRIESPKSVTSGQLFIDHMFLCINIDSRHHTPDRQVPFVNKGTQSHWLIQEETSHMQPDIPAPAVLSKEQQAAFKVIEQRFEEDILRRQNVSESVVEDLKKQVGRYQITRSKGQITGLPIWFGRNAELYIPLADHNIAKLYQQNQQDVRSYFDLMLKVATAHANCDIPVFKQDLRQLYMDMYDHMLDQGFAFGSGLGTIHHYGYNWRSYYGALFIMRDVLREEGQLQPAIDGMQWFAAIGETFKAPDINGMDMDAFNTQVMGRLASVLIMEDTPQKAQYLSCFARWIDNGLLPAPGLNDAFKIDGSAYHHANHYPAYATGGLNGAVRMVYFMSGTPFQVSQLGHETIKKALLTMRFYCNLTQWPVSMSGRHPEGDGALQADHFAILAKAGSPNGAASVDEELASAYLRLVNGKKKDRFKEEFLAKGFQPEVTPTGHITMPYASSSIHRRDEWSASVRGHSRYLWAAEHYIGANLYGRYLAHGQLQIMGGGHPIDNKGSGFVQNGWDWNRFPGTTVINLPLDDLRANILNVDQFSGYEEMLFSDEAFAGGVHANHQNGVYAFILHEHDKYQGSLRALKSYFFFDDKIVCLGSGIENTNSLYPTETILFQNHIGKGDAEVLIDGQAFGTGEKEQTIKDSQMWLIDNKGNGYFLPDGEVYFRQGKQQSRDESSEKPTEGVFATAVVKHGTAPKNAAYHYCVIPEADVQRMQTITNKPEYEVLEQSSRCHIVFNAASNQTGYVFYEATQNNPFGVILSANLPCIAMTKTTEEKLELSITNPDLALYEGPADEIYKDGKRVERSIYSRPWRSNESNTTYLEVELKGKWTTNDSLVSIELTPQGNTRIKMACKDGLTNGYSFQSIDN
jgi:chondroitin-sulfate-ABC endolyase/exolyase